MMNAPLGSVQSASLVTLSLMAWQVGEFTANANPTGGSVVQGSATFSSSGSQFTINQTSANALINWQSFNIGSGETTTFNQPSSSSVVWNQINGSNPSQILGTLNANGYVILQNQNGFYVGGNAAISAHGLVMTTSPTPAPTLSSSTWEFDTPPVGSDIINYGKINIAGGGSAYLIADNIQNYGTIQAEEGRIGLYDGEQVLLSPNPNGQGISAKVTLPKGSVDNEGNLIADGGTIAALAQTVNQNGVVQANTVQNVNGVIELVASDSLKLGANSVISAQGASTGVSSGGTVTIKSDNNLSDQAGSTVNISGGAQGGNSGSVEISAPNLGALQSQVEGQAARGYAGGTVTIDPGDVTLNSTLETYYNGLIAGGNTQIEIDASDTITVTKGWGLGNAAVASTLTLSAGNNIILDAGTELVGGENWSLNLLAGTSLAAGATPPHISDGTQSDGVYLLGTAYLQTQNGNINIQAANEVQIDADPASAINNTGSIGNGIRTLGGGSINVTAQFGDVNTGANNIGFDFNANDDAPYYTVDNYIGGISTAAGGNVTIKAGGSVTSYSPNSADAGDPGTGAFGPEAGDVTITAGGNVYGHYVVANGVGTITAQNGNVGAASGLDTFALSLISGSWTVNAPNGNIYLQEVRNPNGVFNTQGGNGNHLFDYAADATVNLNAGMGVYLTDSNLPRPVDDVQVIYPPELNITAGAGGVNLGGSVTLFPSADQNLSISTTDGGDLTAPANIYVPYELLMSDSAQTVWTSTFTFGGSDHGSLSSEPADPTPVKIDISGNVENLELVTTKETEITVAGNMVNCEFSGQNLHADGVTSINVNGQIYNQSDYTYVSGVTIPSSYLPASDVPAGVSDAWDTIFLLAVNPTRLADLTLPSDVLPSQYLSYVLQSTSLFSSRFVNGVLQSASGDQGLAYDAANGRLWFGGPMDANLLTELSGANSSGQFTILHLVNGAPVLDASGHFETDTVTWVSPALLTQLYNASQEDPSTSLTQYGYRVGGPGQFNITAGSISLGTSYGILSCGSDDPQTTLDGRYNNLASITPSSADLNIEITGPDQTQGEVYQFQNGSTINILPHASLDMLTSTIASLSGGSVQVQCDSGSMDLGSPLTFSSTKTVGLGIYTAAGGDVTLKALGDINIDGSRVASYDGGDIFIESYTGNVEVGSGGESSTGVYLTYADDGFPGYYQEFVYGSGIVANTLVPAAAARLASSVYNGYPPSGSTVQIAKTPGNITVLTPEGNISSTLGGITQEALDGTTTAGPTIDLQAGSVGYVGNIDLGESGVIGGSVTINATGNVEGPIISRQNATVQATGNFSGSVLAGGQASVSGATVTGTIVGVGGVSVSGTVTAEVLGQNVSVNGGASQSTLGTSAVATSTSASAAQQTSTENKQEVASNSNANDDDEKRKKLHASVRVKRVTVILPQKS